MNSSTAGSSVELSAADIALDALLRCNPPLLTPHFNSSGRAPLMADFNTKVYTTVAGRYRARLVWTVEVALSGNDVYYL